MKNNPYHAYKQQSIMTMTPGDMLVTLYDGLMKRLMCAEEASKVKNLSEVNLNLQKAQEIIRYLQGTLDFEYDIAQELNALYDYFLHTTIQMNIKKDLSEVNTLLEMITDLRDTYVQADKKNRMAQGY